MIEMPIKYPEAKCFLKCLLLLVLCLFFGVVRSEDNFETWLGHTSDWAIFYIDEKDHEGRCVGKRISGEFQYQLSISGGAGVWSLLISNSAGLDSLPPKYSLVTLDFDNGEKYSLGASDAEKANLIALNLPAGVIDSLRDASWLSVKVDNIPMDDLSLRRGRELINVLVACHRDRGQSDEEPISAKTAEVENIARLNWQINELRGQGDFKKGIELAQQALAMEEQVFGVGHLLTAETIEDLAVLSIFEGRYAEAESFYMRALAIKEQGLGSEHPSIANSLIGLAVLYTYQGRYAEAEILHKKALDLTEKVLGSDHEVLATAFNGLAGLYSEQGRYVEAESLYKRTLQIRVNILGHEHPRVATTLDGLALVYSHQGRYAEAEAMHRKALTLHEQALGMAHPDRSIGLNNLGFLYFRQSLYSDAELLYKKAIALIEQTLGPEHPRLATGLSNLAWLYKKQNKLQAEQLLHRRVQRIDAERLRQSLTGKQGEGRAAQRNRAIDYLHLLARLETSNTEDHADVMTAVQLARRGQRGDAFRLLAQRLAAGGSGELASLVRKRQDLIQQDGALEQQLIDSYGKPESERPEGFADRLRTQIEELQQQERVISERLQQDFPSYIEFEGSRLTDLASLQRRLQPREAALAWVLGTKESYLLIVPKEGTSRLKTLDVTQSEVAEKVQHLHEALDLGDPSHDGELAAFPAAVAADLFGELFGANWESDLKGIDQLVLVPEGPLTRLAFPVLLTEPPEQPTFSPTSPAYQEAPWLMRRFAISVLPSLSALTVLRGDVPEHQPAEPFFGIGDPLLDDHPSKTRGVLVATAVQRMQVRDVRNAAQVQPDPASPVQMRNLRLERIRQQPSLPDTAEELQRIATLLDADEGALLLREAATEQRLKQTALQGYEILSFATHGVLAGELGRGIEPGLILTPPVEATETDDGFLSLTEVAGLDLNADWVVLSACNTASGADAAGNNKSSDGAEKLGEAEGLTGLAKAFTYAGAKALLVSQWSVASEATVALMEKLFRGYRDQQLSRAEAHRQAMLGMLDAEDPIYRHPSIWAPFVVVGDGG